MRVFALLAASLLSSAAAQPAFTVTTTADDGPGSLRQAILDANATAGADDIAFAIPGTGPHTIRPLSPLPRIEAPVTLDGLTQPGADCDSWPATLQIELDGSETSGIGLDVFTSNTVIRGLVINRFSREGLRISGFVSDGPPIDAADNAVECSYIGTDVTGTVDLGNGRDGIVVQYAARARIGGPGVGQRTLISGNQGEGLVLSTGADGAIVQGSFIGTDVTGSVAIPNEESGLTIVSGSGDRPPSTNHLIGGTDHDSGVCNRACNLISGNDEEGIDLFGPADNPATGTVIQGNVIGTTLNGSAPLGNGDEGISIFNGADNRVGGTEAGAGNLIAFNAGPGVDVTGASLRNAILGNRMRRNTRLGIAIASGVGTPNDPGDDDEGANRIQNHPDLAAATIDDTGTLTVTYAVDTARPNATYPLTVEVFRADADGEEGQRLLGRATYRTADAQSLAALEITAAGVTEGDRVVATATDAEGNSSQFSPSVEVSAGTAASEAPTARGVGLEPIHSPSRRPSVRLSVDRVQELRVTLVDVQGRTLAVLHDGRLPAGEHVLRLPGSTLAPGVYLVRAAGSESGLVARVTVVR